MFGGSTMTTAAVKPETPEANELFRELAELNEHDPRREVLRDQLVRAHMELARRLARKFSKPDESLDDLVQVALVGLTNAINRFDPEQGTDFVSFAVPTITGELRRYFRDKTWSVRVPRRLKELYARISTARETLNAEYSRAPRPSELAEHLGVDIEEVYEALAAEQGRYGTSLDGILEDDGHDRFGSADENLAQAELRQFLRPVIATLSERDREIVLLRYTLGLNQVDIARRVGLSQMHVSRLLNRILIDLREKVSEEPVDV